LQTVTVMPDNNKIKLEVLFDKSSLEVFANNGEKVMTTYEFPDKTATQFSVFASQGDVNVNTLKVWDLSDE